MINLSLRTCLDDQRWERVALLQAPKLNLTAPLAASARFIGVPGHKGQSFSADLIFTGDALVQELNHRYRQKNKPTNVLSFPLYMNEPDGSLGLGESYFAFDTIDKEAKKQQKSFNDHLTHLIIHGVLHLLGYDHEAPAAAEEMESLEIKILGQMAMANPYEELH